jgi:hypothetical protein
LLCEVGQQARLGVFAPTRPHGRIPLPDHAERFPRQ